MIPYEIKIKILAMRRLFAALGSKGLKSSPSIKLLQYEITTVDG